MDLPFLWTDSIYLLIFAWVWFLLLPLLYGVFIFSPRTPLNPLKGIRRVHIPLSNVRSPKEGAGGSEGDDIINLI